MSQSGKNLFLLGGLGAAAGGVVAMAMPLLGLAIVAFGVVVMMAARRYLSEDGDQ